MPTPGQRPALQSFRGLTLIFLLIELLDELVDGLRGAAWPLIHQELGLSYIQIGLLLAIPSAIANCIEPILGIWADLGPRRPLILTGGISFLVALVLIGQSQSFSLLLSGLILFYPASGSFVSLSQATLMDLEPDRHEQNMARWTLAGSVGNVVGPLVLAIAIALGQTWRSGFFLLAGLTAGLLAWLWKSPIDLARAPEPAPSALQEISEASSFRQGFGNAIAALQRTAVLRWLVLLQFSDLMLDVLGGFLALYFVEVVGTTPGKASGAIALWLGFGLLGDFLLLPLLERVSGLTYLRISSSLVLCLYPAMLLAPNLAIKLVILSGLGFLNAGWYSILQGQLYAAMPGKSGTVLTLNNWAGLIGGFMPLVLGAIAQQFGLEYSLWLLWLAPIALLIGLK